MDKIKKNKKKFYSGYLFCTYVIKSNEKKV